MNDKLVSRIIDAFSGLFKIFFGLAAIGFLLISLLLFAFPEFSQDLTSKVNSLYLKIGFTPFMVGLLYLVWSIAIGFLLNTIGGFLVNFLAIIFKLETKLKKQFIKMYALSDYFLQIDPNFPLVYPEDVKEKLIANFNNSEEFLKIQSEFLEKKRKYIEMHVGLILESAPAAFSNMLFRSPSLKKGLLEVVQTFEFIQIFINGITF